MLAEGFLGNSDDCSIADIDVIVVVERFMIWKSKKLSLMVILRLNCALFSQLNTEDHICSCMWIFFATPIVTT